MPKGLAIPVAVNAKGGALLVDGEENDRKIIKLALGSDDSDNAFQQGIGVGLDMIFNINDPLSRPAIQTRVTRVFDKFEAQKRFQLVDTTINWSRGDEPGELVMSFKYVNLESDEERTYREKFSAAGAGARSGGG